MDVITTAVLDHAQTEWEMLVGIQAVLELTIIMSVLELITQETAQALMVRLVKELFSVLLILRLVLALEKQDALGQLLLT